MRAATVTEIGSMEQAFDTRLQSTRCLLDIFAMIGVPRRLLDVGCGSGHLVRIASALGAYAVGLDIAADDEITEGYAIARCDLNEVRSLVATKFDLVLCLEVAEHLDARVADDLCSMLVAATDHILLFSAATPGQGGIGHVNERPHEYWRDLLEARGLDFAPVMTATIRDLWKQSAPAAWWYAKNVMAFQAPGRPR